MAKLKNRSIKIGVLGCSSVAQRNFLPALSSSDIAELWFVGSRNEEKAKDWAKQFGCKHFGTYEEVLESDVDVVYISLPIALHEKWVIKAARSGKHVLC